MCNVIVKSRTSADAIDRGWLSYGMYLAVPGSHGWRDREAPSAPIKRRESAGMSVYDRRSGSPDCKIRSIPFDWPIRCNVRWKSLLPRPESQLANLRRTARETRERSGCASRFDARSRADKWALIFGRCVATPSYDCNYARELICDARGSSTPWGYKLLFADQSIRFDEIFK